MDCFVFSPLPVRQSASAVSDVSSDTVVTLDEKLAMIDKPTATQDNIAESLKKLWLSRAALDERFCYGSQPC